jgi:hypothetical protein
MTIVDALVFLALLAVTSMSVASAMMAKVLMAILARKGGKDEC